MNYQEDQKVINYILAKLSDSTLILGSRLPSERELAEELNICRSSIREAISILRGMGLIESRTGSGNYISNNTEKSIKQMVDIMVKMGSISAKEIIAYRRVISRAVGTELIEDGIKPEYEQRLKQIIEDMRDASDEEFCRLDREFHLGLITATDNKLFTTVMEPVGELYLDIIVEVIMASDGWDRKKRVEVHESILNSILNRDVQECVMCMKEHYDFVESKFNY